MEQPISNVHRNVNSIYAANVPGFVNSSRK